MSHSAAIRCALTALLLLISTIFVLAATIQDDFLYSDEQVTVAPKTNWYVTILIDSEEMTFRPTPGLTRNVMEHVKVYGLVLQTKNTESLSILQGMEFNSGRKLSLMPLSPELESLFMGMPILSQPVGDSKSAMKLPKL